MEHIVIAGTAALALMLPLPAYAAAPAFSDMAIGNGLYANCTSTDASFQLACLAYIAGATDVLVRLEMNCRPYGVTYGQMKDVVINGLKDDATNRHLASSLLIMKYGRAAFPCKK